MVGRTVEVLVEGAGRKGGVQGRTRTNKIVHFDAVARTGEFMDVRVLSAHPHHLGGEIVAADGVGAAAPVPA
jgi:tRNA A37 methylthiotransferase MiaB